jgi:4-alpha-glucanotransferase
MESQHEEGDGVRTAFSDRTSGVLLHLTSLPGPNGSGDLGPASRHFVDWLVSAGQCWWQMLPLTPVGPGNSPYQSASVMAGNPLLVDLDDLVQAGWLGWMPDLGFERRRVDFARVVPHRMQRLRQAWQGFGQHAVEADRAAFAAFRASQATWLDDYALFMALDARWGTPWTQWPATLAGRDPAAMDAARDELADELGFWSFVQWRFKLQWQRLKLYAHARGIRLVGDAPIFVAHHSADVWAHAAEFQLDAAGEPEVVAGVPPDYFSETGQRWGTPVYRWDVMAANGYAWWKQRMHLLLSEVDVIRLDHFRGFESYWAIAASEPTAIKGRWVSGPGVALFDALKAELGALPLIAEDLGIITPAVNALRLACGLPGMRILQFAFGDTPANPYLPHNYDPLTVAYTGTHDNNTSLGWWAAAPAHERDRASRYLGFAPSDTALTTQVPWAMMHAVSQSSARMVIFPFQDVLALDGAHRMNTPGLPEGCWEWRFDWDQVGDEPSLRLSGLTHAHGRNPGRTPAHAA